MDEETENIEDHILTQAIRSKSSRHQSTSSVFQIPVVCSHCKGRKGKCDLDPALRDSQSNLTTRWTHKACHT